MTPAKCDLIIAAGAVFGAESLVYTWLIDDLPVNLTGYSAQMSSLAPNGIALFDWTTANNKVLLGGVQGTISPNASASDTQAILDAATVKTPVFVDGVPGFKIGIWGLKVVNTQIQPIRLLEGDIFIIPNPAP